MHSLRRLTQMNQADVLVSYLATKSQYLNMNNLYFQTWDSVAYGLGPKKVDFTLSFPNFITDTCIDWKINTKGKSKLS